MSFSKSHHDPRFEFGKIPNSKFALRYDYEATKEGVIGGLAVQSNEWERLDAQTWDEAKIEARTIVHSIPKIRFDKTQPHYLQGCVLVELTNSNSFRTCSFTLNTQK